MEARTRCRNSWFCNGEEHVCMGIFLISTFESTPMKPFSESRVNSYFVFRVYQSQIEIYNSLIKRLEYICLAER
jgi:hypothetical protein